MAHPFSSFATTAGMPQVHPEMPADAVRGVIGARSLATLAAAGVVQGES